MKNLNAKFHQGIMFHHFHDDKIFKKSQGSINETQFYKIIKVIGRKNILDAHEFYKKYKLKTLKHRETCLTFDDGLKCQYEIALPVLENLNIKAFFFVNTLSYEDKYQMLEILRYFRTNYFKNMNDFYDNFFSYFEKNSLNEFFKKNKSLIINKLRLYPFYSKNDIKFRLIRDNFLNYEGYLKIMRKLFKEKKFKISSVKKKLYFSKQELKSLDKKGHIIGLHSHNHPTRIDKLNIKQQLNEYSQNQIILSKILKKKPIDIKFMSHPCGNYNQKTLKILNELGIKMGFRHNLEKKSIKKLEIARMNHANIIRNYL